MKYLLTSLSDYMKMRLPALKSPRLFFFTYSIIALKATLFSWLFSSLFMTICKDALRTFLPGFPHDFVWRKFSFPSFWRDDKHIIIMSQIQTHFGPKTNSFKKFQTNFCPKKKTYVLITPGTKAWRPYRTSEDKYCLTLHKTKGVGNTFSCFTFAEDERKK